MRLANPSPDQPKKTNKQNKFNDKNETNRYNEKKKKKRKRKNQSKSNEIDGYFADAAVDFDARIAGAGGGIDVIGHRLKARHFLLEGVVCATAFLLKQQLLLLLLQQLLLLLLLLTHEHLITLAGKVGS